MKKITSCLCILIMTLLQVNPVSAEDVSSVDQTLDTMFEEASSNSSPVNLSNSDMEVEGILYSDDGTIYNVDIFEYDSPSLCSPNEESNTYVLSIEPSYITLASSNSSSASVWDSSYSVKASLTINYKTSSSGGLTTYLLTSVSGSWSISDSSVSLSDRELVYACLSGTVLSQYTTRSLASNSFTCTTGYSTYVVNDNVLSVMGASTSVTLSHGSSSKWTLDLECSKFNNGYSLPSLGRYG